MPLRTLIVAALVMCAALAAPAQAKFAVGMSDQNPRMFDDANFQSLNVQKVRYIVPWDWFKDQAQENEVITYMDRAEAAGAEVLVHFSARRGCYRNDVYSRAKAC